MAVLIIGIGDALDLPDAVEPAPRNNIDLAFMVAMGMTQSMAVTTMTFCSAARAIDTVSVALP